MEDRFEKHREFLVDRIDPDFGLLDKLLASRTLTREAVHKIKLKDNTTEDKNRILLDFILKNKKTKELVSALRDSGQIHLVNYLNADGGYRFAFGDDWPLSESDINPLEINRESLVDLLDTTDLCIRLFSEKIINSRQKQFIFSKPTDAEKNEALLDIFTKCSLRQYKKTIDCLNDSNQSHIADLLSEGGAVVRVHANLEGAVGNVDELEDEIISQLTKVLENHPLDEATRLLELTQLRIIAVRKGHSIVIYIHCTKHDELLQLIDLLKTNRLKGIVEEVFNELLSIGDALRVTLASSQDEFKRAATYFESEDSFDLANDATSHFKEGKEKRSLKLPSVGKWVRKRFSKKKRVLDEATGITDRNHQEIEDSHDVSLSRDLQSKLTVTERPSLSTAMVEEIRHDDIRRWLSGQSSPRSKRSAPLSVYSRRSSGYMSHSSKLAISKGLSSSTLSYDSEAIGLKSRLAAPEELPQLYNYERDVEYISNQEYTPVTTSTKENKQLIELQQERQRDKIKIEELETELHHERRKSSDLTEERKRLQEELEKQKRKFNELKDELESIRKERTSTNLENKVYYNEEPVLVKTIRTKAAEENDKGISGLAIADSELFMTSFQTNDVEVYDLKNLTLTRSWKLDRVRNPYDLGYCKINKCLYLIDATYLNTSKEIFRIDRNGKLLTSWTTGMAYGCISVTYDCNVVMAEYEGHTITEYTADGQIVREIALLTAAGFAHPWHAIKLTNNRFQICHGEGDDPLHRVCVVDANGDIRMSFGGPSGSSSDRLFVPIFMVIDSRGSVIVVDRDNSRVLALSSGLEFTREIISRKKEGMHRPERLVIDQENGRMLVAHNDDCWSDCRVFVFEIL